MAHCAKITTVLSVILAALYVYVYSVTVTGAADAGIGIYASTNAETLTEGRESCITYKLYNPSGVDVTGVLSPAGEIRNITTRTDPPVIVPKGTSYNEGIERKICLKGNSLLHTGCLIGNLFCKTCTGDASYAGSVVASILSSTSGEPIGSSSQPLRVTVLCSPGSSQPDSILMVVIAALLIVGIFLFWKKKRWKACKNFFREMPIRRLPTIWRKRKGAS